MAWFDRFFKATGEQLEVQKRKDAWDHFERAATAGEGVNLVQISNNLQIPVAQVKGFYSGWLKQQRNRVEPSIAPAVAPTARAPSAVQKEKDELEILEIQAKKRELQASIDLVGQEIQKAVKRKELEMDLQRLDERKQVKEKELQELDQDIHDARTELREIEDEIDQLRQDGQMQTDPESAMMSFFQGLTAKAPQIAPPTPLVATSGYPGVQVTPAPKSPLQSGLNDKNSPGVPSAPGDSVLDDQVALDAWAEQLIKDTPKKAVQALKSGRITLDQAAALAPNVPRRVIERAWQLIQERDL